MRAMPDLEVKNTTHNSSSKALETTMHQGRFIHSPAERWKAPHIIEAYAQLSSFQKLSSKGPDNFNSLFNIWQPKVDHLSLKSVLLQDQM